MISFNRDTSMRAEAGADFLHVIITRFNLATPGRESEIRNRPQWLDRRFDLFKQYCFPSVSEQKCKNFSWIVYFDSETPDRYRRIVSELQEEFYFHAYYTGLFPSDGWAGSVNELFSEKRDFIVSTRLDNDDAISKNFIMDVQNEIQKNRYHAPTFFNFTNGLILSGGRLYSHKHSSNAFVSLIERWDDAMVTVASVPHMEISGHGSVVQLPRSGSWLQVVHGENVSNKVRGTRVHPNIALTEFPKESMRQLKETSRAQILLENITVSPLLFVRDLLLSCVHYARRRVKALGR